jgi:iron-sulfur cluster assembly protein
MQNNLSSGKINVTSKAIAEIKKIQSDNGIPSGFGLRIAAKSAGCSGLLYSIGFDEEPKLNDEVIRIEDFNFFVDKKSLFYINGVTMDFTEGLNGKGFIFTNPSRKKSCGCGDSSCA